LGIFNEIPSGKSLLDRIAKGFLQNDNFKDYSHGSALMRPNGLALAPRNKFNFHVFFTINDSAINQQFEDPGLIGALVKSIQLPSYNLGTKEYVQYNRKRLVHNRITYQPVTATFHDDSNDTIRQLWHSYYQYYFADPRYQYENAQTATDAGKTDYNTRDQYDPDRIKQDIGWGITAASRRGSKKPAFFKDVIIYGMARGKFAAYTLVNPVITDWQHDTYDYSQGNTPMQNTMILKYEAVKYTAGNVQDKDVINVKGFAKKGRYDKKPGVLGAAGQAQIDLLNNPISGGKKLLTDLASGDGSALTKGLGAARGLLQGKALLDPNTLKNAIQGDLVGKLASSSVLSPNKFDFPTIKENVTTLPATLLGDKPINN